MFWETTIPPIIIFSVKYENNHNNDNKTYEKVQGEEAAWEIFQQYDRREKSENMGIVKENWPEDRNGRLGNDCTRTGIENAVYQESDR